MDTKRDDAAVARVAEADRARIAAMNAREETAKQQATDRAGAEAAPISEHDRQRREAAAQAEAQSARSAAERTAAQAARAEAGKADAPVPISKMPLAEQGPARWAALKLKIEGEMAALSESLGLINDLIHDANRDGEALAARERAAQREERAAETAARDRR